MIYVPRSAAVRSASGVRSASPNRTATPDRTKAVPHVGTETEWFNNFLSAAGGWAILPRPAATDSNGLLVARDGWTRHTQPTLGTWTLQAGWSGSDTGLGPWTGTSTTSLYQACLIAGCVYEVQWELVSITGGGVKPAVCGVYGTTRTTPGVYTDILTGSINTNLAWTQVAGGTVVIRLISVRNLSLSSVTPDVGTGALTQATPAAMPWDTSVGGVGAVSLGDSVTQRRGATFSTPITQSDSQSVYAVINLKTADASYRNLLRAADPMSNPCIYVGRSAVAGKAMIQSRGTPNRCEVACAAGVRLIRYRHTTTEIALKVDNGTEVAYSGDSPILGTWASLGILSADQGPCSDVYALLILPTPAPDVDLRIRQLLSSLTGATWPTS